MAQDDQVTGVYTNTAGEQYKSSTTVGLNYIELIVVISICIVKAEILVRFQK